MDFLRNEFFPSTPLKWFGALVVAGLAALLLGLCAMQLGLFNVAADGGEMEGIAMMLHHTMQRSAARGAGSVAEPPDLARADLVEAGAAQYQATCSHCHGSPGAGPDRWSEGLNPEPPTLSETAPGYSDKELFWIVRHGVRMTAMPSWPSGGPQDEIWAMVAFLRRLPGLDAAAYASLLAPPGAGKAGAGKPRADVPQVIADVLPRCTGCHGVDGRGRESGAFPRLDLQPAAYLSRSLAAFSEKHRVSGIMQTAAAGLTQARIDALANYFAGKSREAAQPQPPEDRSRAITGPDPRGKAIVESGIPTQHVAPCRSCHDLPAALGTAAEIPGLSGQYQVYLVKRLESWQREDAADSGSYVAMDAISHRLDKADIEAVARYYASLPASREASDLQH